MSKCGFAVVEIHVAFNAQAKATAHVLKLRQCEVAKLAIQALYIAKEHVVAVGLLFCFCDVPREACEYRGYFAKVFSSAFVISFMPFTFIGVIDYDAKLK